MADNDNEKAQDAAIRVVLKKLEALQEKLRKIKNVQSKNINLFSAAGLHTQEIRHSAFFAWLLDKNQPHKLNTLVLEKFIESLCCYDSLSTTDSIITPKTNESILLEAFNKTDIKDLQKDIIDCIKALEISVIREKVVGVDKIDIFIDIKKSDGHIVIVIENKIKSDIHDDQLRKYERGLNNENSPYKDAKKIYVYLRSDGSLPINLGGDGLYNDKWCLFDYQKIYDIVKGIGGKNNNAFKDLDLTIKDKNKLQYIMEDYMETLDIEVLKNNKDFRKKCKEIKDEFKEEIDMLYNYSDNGPEIVSFCWDWIQKNVSGVKSYGKPAPISVNFYTEAMVDYYKRKDGRDLTTDKKARNLGRYYCGSDGDIIGCYLMDKDVDWTDGQTKIINSSDKVLNKKTHKDIRVTVILLEKSKRDCKLEDIEKELKDNLKIFKQKIEDFDNVLKGL